MTSYTKIVTYGCDSTKKSSDKYIMKKKATPKNTIFECGESTGTADFTIGSSFLETFTLARVFVDTSKLCRPQVKIEFSTQVMFLAPSESAVNPVNIRMTFALKRQCGDGPEMTIREWEYINRFAFGGNLIMFNSRSVSEPFTISFCEPLQCPGCWQYFVEVSATPIDDFTNIISAVVNQNNNASISVFAKGICCD